MKKFFLFFFAICQGLISFQSRAQGCWEWETPSLFGSIEVLPSVVVDRNANVYTIGVNFTDSIFYGSFMIHNLDHETQMIVTKTDSSGNVLWVKCSRFAGVEPPTCIATDPQGNLYVFGKYVNEDSIGFDSVTIYRPPLYGEMAFLVKYSPTGNVLWAKNTCQTGLFGYVTLGWQGGLCVDGGGNIYVAGGYSQASVVIGAKTRQAVEVVRNLLIRLKRLTEIILPIVFC